jgi:hypothetical protein
MEQFFGSRLLRLLTGPSQSRLLSLASRPFFLVADRILGAAFLSDIAEFFTLFRTMEAPIVARSRRVGALLSDPATSYLVVTSAEPVAMSEAGFLVDALRGRRHRLEAVLANRLVPRRLSDGALQRAGALASRADPVSRVLADAEREIAAVAGREAEVLSRIGTWEVDVLASESRAGDITDTESLRGLAEAIRLLG